MTSSKKDNETIYEFGLSSLLEKKKCFQVGELVTFQVAAFQDFVKRAYNLQAQQQPQPQDRAARGSDVKRGKVDSIKGHVSLLDWYVRRCESEVIFRPKGDMR